MALAHFRMLIHELLRKDPDIVPEEAPLIVLDSKYAMCMANIGKYTKQKKTHCKENAFFKERRKVKYVQD